MIVSKEAFFSMALDPELFSVKLRLFTYILKFAPPENPTLIASCKKVAEYLDCSVSSVTKTMKLFVDAGYLTKIQNGVWHVEYETLFEQNDANKKISGRP